MEIYELHQLYLQCSGASTDTRNIKKDSMFFALKGENFNANHFAGDALEAGAKYAIIDEKPTADDPRLVLVPDVLETLQQLATFHRRQMATPIIALTGSNGKTTTKELINSCLAKKYRTLATEGNLNNHIGVPLTLLRLDSDTELGIIEMGANHPGEIAFLSEITQPDFGYITNFGKAHLEGFKSPEGVIAAKSELYHHLKANGKTLFLNADDPVQWKQSSYGKIYSFGGTSRSDIKIDFPPANPFAVINVEGEIISSSLIGAYNAKNIAAAFTIGKFFQVPTKDLQEAIGSYTPKNNRSQILERGTNRIILDAYNANPTSMAAAIDNLDGLEAAHKIAILGDMFELGDYALMEHQQLAERLESSSIDEVYFLGQNFYSTTTGKKIKKYRDFDDFKAAFDPTECNDATILIKGSRGMALERVLELL